ncbi:BrnA antitoxin family protein [Candidatus Nitrospira salsa]
MKKERITKVSGNELKKMEDRTHANPPVGPSLPKDFWKTAKVVYPASPKEAVKVRYDRDVLDWFKAQGRGYQTRMNAVLRSYYEAHKDEPSVKQ